MRGGSVKDALIVEVPGKDPVIPRTATMDDQEKIAQECSSLDDWSIGTVHEIPAISRFMSQLGGCTETGKIFWRLEDKQVVSLIIDGWFRESTTENRNALENKKSILIGSPGIGKSTLLCLMAFYLVFKRKKNVFLYRRTYEQGFNRCLLYMTHDAVQVVCFSVPSLEDPEASEIYEALTSQICAKNIWVLLDGFPYGEIPAGFEPFDMLATSQQVDLKSLEAVGSYCCLLPSWSKTDLMSLGRLLYEFAEDEMETRFYYSGGSVRDFTMDTVDDMRRGVDNVVTRSENTQLLFSSRGSILSGNSQFDRLRRTFVENSSEIAQFALPRHWEQVIDSEYALRSLSEPG
ncbi:hypothetical protein PHYSODRAFT_528849 [Phytophthora sojae]|uniref:NACHT domain-containing protein n=1 Tax=Phytophthora sojae (strain P6497) TaxID=1094619 RepID=G5A9M0_PHYSP|nr:hypothetical protein PHYSODRAFT_528849 [Phytophthora sojae]EGZ07300.1 hypothetical protein PHYSODRAFT_528849 [Phytophthora sojae]|eukprot:XP_009536866.1 hypothetical protein PHYSODRAFT_528849 [Phytophthora sojae]